MYHEEQVVNGILCHRTTPNGEWLPYSPEALTTALVAERAQHEKYFCLWSEAKAKLEQAWAAITRV